MSAQIMFRKCEHCRRKYTYNPSVGNFGLFCPKCGKVQSLLVAVRQGYFVRNKKRIL